MKAIEVNINDIKVSNSVELTKLIVRYILLSKNFYLSETEIHALTHFIVKGFSSKTREELISFKLLKSRNVESNLISKFRKYGIIVKHNFGERLHSDFSFNVDGIDGVFIKVKISK